MPSPYNVAHGMRGVHKNTTIADTIDIINFDRSCGSVRFISNGADDFYVTLDGSDPTIGGANCERMPAGVISVMTLTDFGNDITVVKVRSASPVVYSVTGT